MDAHLAAYQATNFTITNTRVLADVLVLLCKHKCKKGGFLQFSLQTLPRTEKSNNYSNVYCRLCASKCPL